MFETYRENNSFYEQRCKRPEKKQDSQYDLPSQNVSKITPDSVRPHINSIKYIQIGIYMIFALSNQSKESLTFYIFFTWIFDNETTVFKL